MSEDQQIDEIHIKFENSRSFRVIHATGAWGSVTPDGGIEMAFYNDRFSNPTRLTLKQEPDGRLSEKSRDVPELILRELEVDVRMSLVTARAVHEWLGKEIEKAEKFEGPRTK